jgi:hypothetical protein
MKVVYDDPIVKRIQRAVYEADVAGRRIGHIEVTVSEANELSRYLRSRLFFSNDDGTFYYHYTYRDAGKVVGKFFGVEIRVESK